MYRRPQVNLRILLRAVKPPTRSLTVLALESSADDTCAAVITSSRQILSNVVVKQHDMLVVYFFGIILNLVAYYL